MIKLQINALISSEKMVQLTTEQRVFIVKNYLQTQSSTAVQNSFQARFPGRNPPTLTSI